MSSEAWVGLAAMIVTTLAGGVGWATYIAWMASRMYTLILGLRADVTAHKDGNDLEHQRIWKVISELSHVSQAHESRLVRLEAIRPE